jgi:4-aminobutyrate aminotransferase-like enzyme
MMKAAFQYMYDDKGNTYLDCVNNICHVGHCHPRVVEAGQRQMANLNTNTRYLYDSLNEYAENLCATFPDELKKIFFVNSGSAATDLALRLARKHTRQDQVIVVDHAYHGNVTSAIEVSPYKFDGRGGDGCVATTHKVAIPDTYRGNFRETDENPGQKYAEEVDRVLKNIHQKGENVAAFICESIIGCGGQIMLPEGYLEEVYQKVRKHGGVCIADEVQVGFGRVGSSFWGFEMQHVIPDIVILGKPMGNGHPLAAVVTTEQIARSFEDGMEFFSSFGGNPVSCAIGQAVLDVIHQEKLQHNAMIIGDKLIAGLHDLKSKNPIIGDIRGSGLFLGIEFVLDPMTREPAPQATKTIVEEMKKRKILLSTDGPFHNVIKFKPPMVFSPENADHFLTNLESVLINL